MKPDTSGRCFEAIFLIKFLNHMAKYNIKTKPNYTIQELEEKLGGYIDSNGFTMEQYIDTNEIVPEEGNRDIINDFIISSEKILEWLLENHSLNEAKSIYITRFDDVEGINGNATDIKIKAKYDEDNYDELNLSLKNNNNALKHPRNSNLPDIIFASTKHKNQFIKCFNDSWEKFASLTDKRYNLNVFEEIRAKDENYINNHLYIPIINCLSTLLSHYKNDGESVKGIYEFIISGRSIDYQIINKKKKNIKKNIVEIKYFNEYFLKLGEPESFNIENKSPYTIILHFSNDCDIEIRIHHDKREIRNSSGTINKSIKYDVRPVNWDIKTDTIYKHGTLDAYI